MLVWGSGGRQLYPLKSWGNVNGWDLHDKPTSSRLRRKKPHFVEKMKEIDLMKAHKNCPHYSKKLGSNVIRISHALAAIVVFYVFSVW